VTVFNRELFLGSVPEEDRDFYAAFVGTSMFHEFSDSLMDETSTAISSRVESFSTPSIATLARTTSTFDPDLLDDLDIGNSILIDG
jgi:hypothetical protein